MRCACMSSRIPVEEVSSCIGILGPCGGRMVYGELASRSRTHSSEESLEELRSVGDEVLVILEDGVNCKHGILPDERVTVFLRM